MKIYGFATIAAAAVATPALAWAHRGYDYGGHSHDQGGRRVVYVFDGDYAGGIDGTIQTIWDSNDDASTQVTIEADLRFKRVDKNALMKADGNCKGLPTQYAWHIHTLWNQSTDNVHSASYAQCARSITGNHFDPTKACGPASEFVDTPGCAGKPMNYKCMPAGYAQNFASCEVGDLSGKLGPLTPDKDGKLHVTLTDVHYASWAEQQPTWNIVIHAVCGSASPRVACARGMRIDQGSCHQKRLRGSTSKTKTKVVTAKFEDYDEPSYEHDEYGHDHGCDHGDHRPHSDGEMAMNHHDDEDHEGYDQGGDHGDDPDSYGDHNHDPYHDHDHDEYPDKSDDRSNDYKAKLATKSDDEGNEGGDDAHGDHEEPRYEHDEHDHDHDHDHEHSNRQYSGGDKDPKHHDDEDHEDHGSYDGGDHGWYGDHDHDEHAQRVVLKIRINHND